MKKRNKGITLIALIITIVVMLILVGVVVSTTINSNLIGKAKTESDKWNVAEKKESNLAGMTVGDKHYGSLQDYVNKLDIGYSGSSQGSDRITVGDLIYQKTSDTEVAVVGLANKEITEVVIPSTINKDGKEYEVTSIGVIPQGSVFCRYRCN